MKREKVWMNGHTCLQCGIGWYNGYNISEPANPVTNPCNKCGHVTNASMFRRMFEKLIKERDELKCDDCGVNQADPPSKLCPGCEAYKEHQT